MNYLKMYFILFVYICCFSKTFNSFISLPFTYINNKTGKTEPDLSNTKEYFESLFDNPIYTTLNINKKEIKAHITMDRYATYISEKTLKEVDPNAVNEKNEKENLYSLEYIGIRRAVFANSTFYFRINYTNDISPYQLSFFMAKIMNYDAKDIQRYCYAQESEEIGFNLNRGNKLNKVRVENPEDDDYRDYDDDYYDYDTTTEEKEKKVYQNDGFLIEENTNLISQLKKQDAISSYSYLVKYNNKNEEKGQIIIGGLPHEYDPDHYKEENFRFSLITIDDNLPNWRYDFQDIKYGEEILTNTNIGEFSINSGFIVTSISNKYYFDKTFFQNSKYENYCSEKIVGDYYVKTCQEKVIKEFKNLTFALTSVYSDDSDDNKLIFDYNDLFIKSNDNDLYYFQIVFKSGYFRWLLGRPLFKKYPMVFDQNKKIFGFYTQMNMNDNSSVNNEKGKKFSLVWVLVIVLSICLCTVIGISIACYIKITKDNRKKKANELIDDNYAYEPENKNEIGDEVIN